ncbi:hypothetical protein HIM_00540 [Hirsutella minnesotensis 3608]|nr:hypothetical protein HIM_00540 [Hirsutella minnesotensis 3608]
MTSAASTIPEVVRLTVENVQIRDGNLTWTKLEGDSVVDQVSLNELLFIVDSSKSPPERRGYVICCLQEDLENQARPFRLLLVSTESLSRELLGHHVINQIPEYLRANHGNLVDVVVSTKSGLGLSLSFWQAVVRPLLELSLDVAGDANHHLRPFVTEDAESVRDYARALPSGAGATDGVKPSRTIVLLSGDGGIVDLLNSYEPSPDERQPLIALLPLGTGNALFHSLHKPIATASGPSAFVLGVRTLFLGRAADLPIFRASFSAGSHVVSHVKEPGLSAETGGASQAVRKDAAVSSLYGAIVASYGFHASIVYESDTPEYRAHGDKRFGMVAQQLLRESHPYKANLTVQGSPSPSRAAPQPERDPRATHGYILVSMVSNLERAFSISPASRPLDGQLRLVHFGPVGGERTMDVMMKAYDGGKHVGMAWDDGEAVRYQDVDEVAVELLEEDPRWRKFCVDGTIVEVPEGGSMTVGKVPNRPFRILVDQEVLQGP